MADRLNAIEARIESIGQLSSVIGAMRGIAATRLHEAAGRLDAIRTYAGAVGAGIAQALALLPGSAPSLADGMARARTVIAFGSEHGFVGAFNTRIFDAAMPLLELAPGGRASLVVVGGRGLAAARERGPEPDWSTPMAAHIDETATLANRLSDNLFDLLPDSPGCELLVVHAVPAEGKGAQAVVTRRLLPFDYSRFPQASRSEPPLIELPPSQLLARLVDEHVFAELCEASVMSFAAENEARMLAMAAAKTNVAQKHDELVAEARRLRQEQITEEVVELAAGSRARLAG
ncbi:MAG: F0F1 ATP synthase subunit gamma [Sphingomonadales bacterium]|nr:F0F1 ATP synthase subunit gamma [Sphingomonadales bacterium]MDE2568754.1 F0F1 ATP synthase subunit gamma [Sphingomonadales bacterium]